MDLQKIIRKVLREQVDKKTILKNYAEKNGLDDTFKMIGGELNYIKIVYDGDFGQYFKSENVKPYEIKEGETANMYINDSIIQSLDLPDYRSEKDLGDFRYGPNRSNLPYKCVVRVRKIIRNGLPIWHVVGISGSHGFGYYGIPKKEILGKTYRKQIFQQIIDKYNLNQYLQ